jgi:hypothetical protein
MAMSSLSNASTIRRCSVSAKSVGSVTPVRASRPRYDRSKLRYPSDLTDQEWAPIRRLIPPAKKGGNKRTVDVRAVVNGVMESNKLFIVGTDNGFTLTYSED